MGMGISVDILVGPVVGGLGTAFGPLVGTLITLPLDHLASAIGNKFGIPGLNNVAYGLALIAAVWLLPDGIVPAMVNLAKSVTRFSWFGYLQMEQVKK